MAYDVENERREKNRVDFQTQVVMKAGSSEIRVEGSSRDLSFKGIFVNTQADISIGTRCRVEILLAGTTDRVAIQVNGSVVRKESSGIAVEFDSMDLGSYSHLKNLVRYHAAHANQAR